MKKFVTTLALGIAFAMVLPACGGKKGECKPCNKKTEHKADHKKVEKKELTKKSSCAPCQKTIKGGKEDYSIQE